jgi:hypothetical protein
MRSGFLCLVIFYATQFLADSKAQSGALESRTLGGPSFACSRASDALSKFICDNRELWISDLQLVQAYQALRAFEPSSEGRLRAEASALQSNVYVQCNIPRNAIEYVDWQSSINRASVVACIQMLYLQRRAVWLSLLREDGLREASRPIMQHFDLQRALIARVDTSRNPSS